MYFSNTLQQAHLIKRYKRFLADIRLPDGQVLTVHCPNTGRMSACAQPDSRVWFWHSGNLKRKYPHTLELVEVDNRFLACINTQRANALVDEAIQAGIIAPLQGYQSSQREVSIPLDKNLKPVGDTKKTASTRIDFLLTNRAAKPTEPSASDQLASAQLDCYVEVKNVTWWRGQTGCKGLGEFPDAVTTRGLKHIKTLEALVAQGKRAVLLFCVAHTGIDQVGVAMDIDPDYGLALQRAVSKGVEVYAYGTSITPQAISITHALPVKLGN